MRDPRLLLIAVLMLPLFGCAKNRPMVSGAELAAVVRENEAVAAKICRELVQAQLFHAREDRDGDGVREYAQTFLPTRKSVDGLGGVASAPGEIGSHWAALAKARPARGYCYAILTSQGATAPGGVRDYLIGGHLTGGFAAIAWPARYGLTGRNAFLVNQSGIVLAKDLGPDTAKIARQTTRYEPDASWHPASPQPPGKVGPDAGVPANDAD